MVRPNNSGRRRGNVKNLGSRAPISRRRFLRTAGVAAAGVGAAAVGLGGVAKAHVIDNGDGSCTVYPKGTATIGDFELTQGSNSIPCTEDAYNIEQAIKNYSVVRLSRNNESGAPTEFKVYIQNADYSAPDAVIDIGKDVTITSLEPNNPPVLDCKNLLFNGFPGASWHEGIKITANACTLNNLVIFTNRRVLITSLSGQTRITNCEITNNYSHPYNTITSEAIQTENSGDVFLNKNLLSGAPALKIGRTTFPFQGRLTAIGNDLVVTDYTHFLTGTMGVDIPNTSENSSVLLNDTHIDFQLPHEVDVSPVFRDFYGIIVPQFIVGVLMGNGIWGTGANNVDINNLVINSNYQLHMVGIMEHTHDCSLKKIQYSEPTRSYDYTGLGYVALAVGNPDGYDFLGFVTSTDYFLYKSTHNTIMDNNSPFYTIYDSTDPDPLDETYAGENTLLGRMRKVYNVVPANPASVQMPNLTNEQRKELRELLKSI